jgi:secreted trypsin-like serine protease
MRNNLKKALIFSLCMTVLTGCGGGSGDSEASPAETSLCVTPLRVLGGASCSNLPSPVVGISIQYDNGTSGLCSGSVISSTSVLTAAHCFLAAATSSVDIYNSKETISGTTITLHPGVAVTITGEVRNDLAIVTLSKPFSDIVPLRVTSASPRVGTELLVYGYGLDDNGNSGTLRAGRLTTSGNNSFFITANAKAGINPCNGDSGGPALMASNGGYVITGVLSAGSTKACSEGDINFYTRLDSTSTRNFINQHKS